MFGRKRIAILYKGSRISAKDYGPLHFKTSLTAQEGGIMAVARKDVRTITPLTSIKTTASIMVKYGFKRLPVANAGTNLLLGIVSSRDIVNFLGGGGKFNIIREKYHGNFLAAVNESVREIMV